MTYPYLCHCCPLLSLDSSWQRELVHNLFGRCLPCGGPLLTKRSSFTLQFLSCVHSCCILNKQLLGHCPLYFMGRIWVLGFLMSLIELISSCKDFCCLSRISNNFIHGGSGGTSNTTLRTPIWDVSHYFL